MSVILVSVLEISWKRQGEVKGGYTSQATSLITLRIGVLEAIKVNKWGLGSCIIKTHCSRCETNALIRGIIYRIKSLAGFPTISCQDEEKT
jgi:hypothetical protein